MAIVTRRWAGALLSVGLLSGVAFAPAAFGDVRASTTGARAWTTNTTTVWVRDTSNDDRWVSGQYIQDGQSGTKVLVNQAGPLTNVSRYHSSGISSVKACRSNPATPMTCGGWNNGF